MNDAFMLSHASHGTHGENKAALESFFNLRWWCAALTTTPFTSTMHSALAPCSVGEWILGVVVDWPGLSPLVDRRQKRCVEIGTIVIHCRAEHTNPITESSAQCSDLTALCPGDRCNVTVSVLLSFFTAP